ncbi:MAG TPA: hypothetical protein VMH35_12100 [Streptosporangiaceae bacterium]|nr:hypothetical protein [Streptosporangiaceae bacterium]
MRLRLIDRVRRYIRRGPRGSRTRGPARAGPPGTGSAPSPAGAGRHRREYAFRAATPAGTAAPPAPPAPASGSAAGPPPPGAPPSELPRRVPRRAGRPAQAGAGPPAAGQARAATGGAGQARAAIRPAPGRAAAAGQAAEQAAARPRARQQAEPDAARLPWYEVAHARRAAEGMADCGPLEDVLHREWHTSVVPSAPVVKAVNRLARLPLVIKDILAAGLDAIHVGEGGVPELDDMARLRGVPLPSGRATWDACAGAYGQRKIIVGSRPSAAPDVMCHEVGHALDDIDRVDGRWQSDSAPFRHLYQRCRDALVSDFHRQPGDLGRREFFADAFAAIASQQRPALVDMLGGNTRVALDVMLYFNVRYGL